MSGGLLIPLILGCRLAGLATLATLEVSFLNFLRDEL